MNPSPVGIRIRVTGNSNSHDYRIGSIQRVHDVDDDGTFRAIDENGQIGKFLKWSDCEHAGIGWDWLRTQLDPRSLDLLSAFDGVEHLSLNPEMETRLVLAIPNLEEAILGVLPGIEDQACQLAALAADPDDEDCDPDPFSDPS